MSSATLYGFHPNVGLEFWNWNTNTLKAYKSSKLENEKNRHWGKVQFRIEVVRKATNRMKDYLKDLYLDFMTMESFENQSKVEAFCTKSTKKEAEMDGILAHFEKEMKEEYLKKRDDPLLNDDLPSSWTYVKYPEIDYSERFIDDEDDEEEDTLILDRSSE